MRTKIPEQKKKLKKRASKQTKNRSVWKHRTFFSLLSLSNLGANVNFYYCCCCCWSVKLNISWQLSFHLHFAKRVRIWLQLTTQNVFVTLHSRGQMNFSIRKYPPLEMYTGWGWGWTEKQCPSWKRRKDQTLINFTSLPSNPSSSSSVCLFPVMYEFNGNSVACWYWMGYLKFFSLPFLSNISVWTSVNFFLSF